MVSPRKILKITAMRSDAKVATRKGSNWAQIRSLPRRSLFARFELCTAAMCEESETCQVPKTCTKLPHSHPKRGVLACRISWRSQFCVMYWRCQGSFWRCQIFSYGAAVVPFLGAACAPQAFVLLRSPSATRCSPDKTAPTRCHASSW